MRVALRLALLSLSAVPSSPVGAEHPRRLPAGFHQGRCLYVVDGKTRIDGRCFYQISKGGGFHIDGPRQVYEGIDYPKAETMAGQRSADYWADVFPEDGGWTGYGTDRVAEVHGSRQFGALRREGACFTGKDVRVCLWSK